MNRIVKLAAIIIAAGFVSYRSVAQAPEKQLSSWAYDSIYIPVSEISGKNTGPVIVAVVDDGFRLSHNELKGFIYKNPDEVPGNKLDDDGNSCTDDVFGWDISDNDNDVSVSAGRENMFYHGTFLAGIITRVATLHFGSEASERIKIMPVKVLSDMSDRSYIRDGYKGVEYAMKNGADIICCAWSGGQPGAEELRIIADAYKRGILIISSVGNFGEEKIPFPADLPEVLAVAGINRMMQKAVFSNYGTNADIAAPAESVSGPHPATDNSYISDNGTSAAAALVTASAALLLSKNPELSNSDLRDALINSSTPFSKEFAIFGGKVGAGVLNIENALAYADEFPAISRFYSPLRSKGSIVITKETLSEEWEIDPAGSYHGYSLSTKGSELKNPGKHTMTIILNDTVWNRYNLATIPEQLYIPSSPVKIEVPDKKFRNRDFILIEYAGKTVDSTKLYCDGIQYLHTEAGSIDDGSGEKNYSNNSSCKWIITVPSGKRIRFSFDQMDTEANTDVVYLVDGQTAIPENIFARFSGQNLPPVVISGTNEVLVWFLTDSSGAGQGWRVHFEAVDTMNP